MPASPPPGPCRRTGGRAEAVDPSPPATMPVTNRLVVDLGAQRSSLRIDRELLAESVLPGAYVSVGVSPSAAFDVPSLLLTLDRYPYGCAEQTTSRALPLLYVSELAGAGMAGRSGAARPHPGSDLSRSQLPVVVGKFRPLVARLGRSLARFLRLGFPDQGARTQLRCAAASHDAGAEQPAELAFLRVDVEDRGSEIAYALYVLARNRRPPSATCAIMPTRSSRLSRARWRWRSLPRALRSTATRSVRSDLPGRASTGQRQSEHDYFARIMARGCATARPCWRSPPKASRCQPSCPN